MDDEGDVLRVLSLLLQRLGFAVHLTSDGREMLERYGEALAAGAPYDLVILDLMVPGGMGGVAAVGELLRLDARARAVVVSGYCDEPVLAEHRRFGFVAALSKPFTIAALTATLRSVLEPTA